MRALMDSTAYPHREVAQRANRDCHPWLNLISYGLLRPATVGNAVNFQNVRREVKRIFRLVRWPITSVFPTRFGKLTRDMRGALLGGSHLRGWRCLTAPSIHSCFGLSAIRNLHLLEGDLFNELWRPIIVCREF